MPVGPATIILTCSAGQRVLTCIKPGGPLWPRLGQPFEAAEEIISMVKRARPALAGAGPTACAGRTRSFGAHRGMARRVAQIMED